MYFVIKKRLADKFTEGVSTVLVSEMRKISND